MSTLHGAEPGAPTILVLGSGTVGAPVQRHLRHNGHRVLQHISVPWTDDHARREVLRDLGAVLVEHARRGPVRIVWAAGATGFSATTEETAQEEAAFVDVVEMATELLTETADHGHRLHVVSSAGGLFEGGIVRSSGTPPAPRRPYGDLKLRQEQVAAARLPLGAVVVHRPSSIYGSPGGGRRPGLLGHLVEQTLRMATTRIFGSPMTLRDYVHAEDVGRHVALAARSDTAPSSPELLVAGRPTSIHEVIRVVATRMNRAAHVHYVDAWNARDIVFLPSVRAAGFRPASIEVGVRRVRDELLSRTRRR